MWITSGGFLGIGDIVVKISLANTELRSATHADSNFVFAERNGASDSKQSAASFSITRKIT